MSDDDLRNTLIVELGAQTGSPVPQLQGLTNIDLVLRGLGKPAFAVNAGRMCDYLDGPGTPQIGIRSYGLKGRRHAAPLSWSLTGTVNGVTPPQMQSSLNRAFALWTSAAPGLGFNLIPSGGDIKIRVGDLGAPNPTTGTVMLGLTTSDPPSLTSPDSFTITLNNNPGVSFVAT